MSEIQNFTEITADGHIIYDYMTVSDINWEPSKIETVYWDYRGKRVTFTEDPKIGIVATALKELDLVVFSRTVSSEGDPKNLTAYNADGTIRFSVPNKLVIHGKEETGEFLWLQTGWLEKYPGHFVIVFEVYGGESYSMYNILVDAKTGETKYLSEAR